MAVSHYVVSWIQVIGAIVGLDGFFFVSISIFGRKSTPWFRALLPATGMALAVLLVSRTDPAFSSPPLPPILGWFFALGLVGWSYSAAVFGTFGKVFGDSLPAEKLLRFYLLIATVLATVAYVAVVGLTAFQVISGRNMGADARTFGLMTGVILFIWSLVWPDQLPRIVSEVRLQKIGFVLSALAILTQFIPPVLDLLNIAVK